MSIARTKRAQRKNDHVRILAPGPIIKRSVGSIQPSPENDQVYHPINPEDPGFVALCDDVQQRGILEPLLISEDGWIISGHRRFAAAEKCGILEVDCRVFPICKFDNLDGFMRLLTACNRQREKTLDEILREEVVASSPEETHRALIAHRRAGLAPTWGFHIRGPKSRAKISKAKRPMLDAILRILEEAADYLPMSDRQIHYKLLNDPPLTHASKPRSRYRNNDACYKKLCELLTRARLEGLIPMEHICDETRPVSLPPVHRSAAAFLRHAKDTLLRNYWRDYQQSQPTHVEIIGEKNTISGVLDKVGNHFCIPVTIARGFSSLRPRYDVSRRYKASGKNRLLLLIMSDFDPSGEEIAHSFARSLRDEFGIDEDQVEAVKVGLRHEHIARFKLVSNMEAKPNAQGYERFVATYGKAVFELEALDPSDLEQLLVSAIDFHLDTELLNAEIDKEREESAYIEAARQRMIAALAGVGPAPGGGG